eukprot:scaffold651624_cov41-Prasinocladus_malaysianus.AAC.1
MGCQRPLFNPPMGANEGFMGLLPPMQQGPIGRPPHHPPPGQPIMHGSMHGMPDMWQKQSESMMQDHYQQPFVADLG